MEIRGLRSLVHLAELGTIARCAEIANISAAAVHKQLKVLEDELDVRLYEHIGRRLQLTPAAEVLLPHARSLLAEHDAALAALKEWRTSKRGMVRLGCGATLSSYVMPPLLAEFHRRNPDIELHVQTGHIRDLADSLADGSLDVVIQVESTVTKEPSFVVEQSWEYEVVLVSARRLSPRPRRLAQLSEEPFILYKKAGLFGSLVDSYLAAAGLQPRVAMRVDNGEGVRSLACLGLGMAALPVWLVHAEIASKRLFLFRQKEAPLVGKIELVRRNCAHQASPVSAFVELARGWRWANLRLAQSPPADAPCLNERAE